MSALEVVSGFVTAPGVAAFTVLTQSNGTTTVRNFSQGAAYLLTAWKNGQAVPGALRFRSPRFHDNVNGIRFSCPQVNTSMLLDPAVAQQLVAQDTLTIDAMGSAVAGDIENCCALIYYDQLDQANGRFISPADLYKRKANILGLPFAIAGAATGAWGPGTALNAGIAGAILKANVDYAVLGISLLTETAANNSAAVGITGPDTGNLMIAVPSGVGAQIDERPQFFLRLAERTGRPLIPVINAANAGGTLLQVLNNENANTATFSLVLAELR
jgi:hypothetical protein